MKAKKELPGCFICSLALRHACKLVFAISLLIGFLLVPQSVLESHFALALLFFITFAYTFACVAYAARENIRHAKGTSTLSVLASAVGLAALSACGAAACGTIGVGIFSLALPLAAVHFFSDYGAYIVGASILLQLALLWKMRCLSIKAMTRVAKS
jgi:hypothetical protein